MSDEIDDIISGGGLVFKKKKYITGAHGSGSARQKAKYREQRANRHKK